MTPSVVAALLWAIGASLAPLLPAGRVRPAALTALVVLGVPLLGWLTLAHGPWLGLAAFAAGAALLRWPPADWLHGLRTRLRPPPPPAGPAE